MFNPDQNRLAPTLAMIMAASLVGFITGYTVPLISLELAQQQIGAAPLQFIMLRIAAGRPAKRRGHRLLIHCGHAAPPVNG